MSEQDHRSNEDRINWAALYQQRKDRVGPECLTVEALAAYLQGTGSPAARPAVESHLRQCDRCAAELEYWKAFEANDPPAGVRAEDIAAIEERLRAQARDFVAERFPANARGVVVAMPAPPPRRRAAPRWTQRLFAVAASLVVILGIIYYAKTREPQPPDGGGPDRSSVRGRHVELGAPLGALAEAPAHLSWEPVPGATRYMVRITEVDGRLVWSETVTATQATLPAAIRAELVRAKTYYWFVEAQSDAGTLGRSSRGFFLIELPQKKSP